MNERKRCELKQLDDTGAFEAVIATLGVVDHDGDVIARGAFGGAVVSVVPTHRHDHVPIGKAKIEEVGDLAVARGVLNLDTASGREWHAALKFDLEHPPSVQEWSFAFVPHEVDFEQRNGQRVRVLRAMDVIEVSPVLRGAGIQTGTLAVKHRGHETPTSEAVWDAGAQARKVRDGEAAEYYAQVYAWCDPENELAGKSAWRVPHHFVADDGTPGAASVRACVMGILSLADSPLSEAEQRAIHAHLAKHLRDAGLEPPDLGAGMSLRHQLDLATWACEAAVERVREVATMRSKEGRRLSGDLLAKARALTEAHAWLVRGVAELARPTPEEAALAQTLARLTRGKIGD